MYIMDIVPTNMTTNSVVKKVRYEMQGLIQAVSDISIPIFSTLIWVCPNSILSKTETTTKRNSSFLIKSAM